jgi:hypothetical protein
VWRASAAPATEWQAQAPAMALAFRPHRGTPGLVRSVAAEGLLPWQSASWVKWPMLAASAATLVIPGNGVAAPIAVFLLLLGPVIGEAAAREELYGTGATVFAQPGVPRSTVGRKAAAISGFVLLVGAPVLLRSFARGVEHGLAMLLGMAFVAGAATGLGWLSRGGKLFLGLFTALWYVAVQRESPLDFTGAFARPDLQRCAIFAAIGVGATVVAALVERARPISR